MQIIALFNPGLFIRNTITMCTNELIRFTPLDLSGTFSIQRKRSQKVKPGLRIKRVSELMLSMMAFGDGICANPAEKKCKRHFWHIAHFCDAQCGVDSYFIALH